MGQTEQLRAFDKGATDAFVRAGLADRGIYTPIAGSPFDCTAVVDHAVQTLGDYGQVSGPRDVVTLLLAEVPNPRKGDRVTVDAETFTLESRQSADASHSVWIVANG